MNKLLERNRKLELAILIFIFSLMICLLPCKKAMAQENPILAKIESWYEQVYDSDDFDERLQEFLDTYDLTYEEFLEYIYECDSNESTTEYSTNGMNVCGACGGCGSIYQVVSVNPNGLANWGYIPCSACAGSGYIY